MDSSRWEKFKAGFFIILLLSAGLMGVALFSLENYPSLGRWLMALFGYYFLFGAIFGYFNQRYFKLAIVVAWSAILVGLWGLLTTFGKGSAYFFTHLAILLLPAFSALLGSYFAPRLWRRKPEKKH